MVEKIIYLFSKAYEILIQFGYACWSTANEGDFGQTILSTSIFNEMLGRSGTLTITSSSFLYGSVYVFYSLVCGIFTDIGNVGINIINWVVRIFGGTSLIPSIVLHDVPMIIGIVLAIPFWIGLFAVIHLIGKILKAIPFL